MDSRVYVDDLKRRALTETYLQELALKLKSPELDSTKASVIELRTAGRSSHTGITSLTHFISKIHDLDASWSAKQQSPTPQKAARVQLVVIENPSPDFIDFLGIYYEVSPEFFVDYAAGCGPKKHRIPPRLPSQSLRSSFLHADGVQSYLIRDMIGKAPNFTKDTEVTPYLTNRNHYFKRRSWQRADKSGFQIEDRMSYFVKSRSENDWIGICLLDPRLFPRMPTEHEGNIRLPSSDDGWQGSLFSSTTSSLSTAGFSLHDAFTAYLANDFTLEEFVENAFSPTIFLYLHLAITWNEQITRLTATVRRLSFNPIPAAPTLDITDHLQEIRSSIYYMSTSIQHICEQVEYRSGTTSMFDSASGRNSWGSSFTRNDMIRSRFQDLHQDFRYFLHRTEELQSLVTETVNILIATASISESKSTTLNGATALHQNVAVTKLLRLAAIYLPLIFGCAFFSMNIQQINSTGQQLWVFFIMGLGLVYITLLALMVSKLDIVNLVSMFARFWGKKWGKKWGRPKMDVEAV